MTIYMSDVGDILIRCSRFYSPRYTNHMKLALSLDIQLILTNLVCQRRSLTLARADPLPLRGQIPYPCEGRSPTICYLTRTPHQPCKGRLLTKNNHRNPSHITRILHRENCTVDCIIPCYCRVQSIPSMIMLPSKFSKISSVCPIQRTSYISIATLPTYMYRYHSRRLDGCISQDC